MRTLLIGVLIGIGSAAIAWQLTGAVPDADRASLEGNVEQPALDLEPLRRELHAMRNELAAQRREFETQRQLAPTSQVAPDQTSLAATSEPPAEVRDDVAVTDPVALAAQSDLRARVSEALRIGVVSSDTRGTLRALLPTLDAEEFRSVVGPLSQAVMRGELRAEDDGPVF